MGIFPNEDSVREMRELREEDERLLRESELTPISDSIHLKSRVFILEERVKVLDETVMGMLKVLSEAAL